MLIKSYENSQPSCHHAALLSFSVVFNQQMKVQNLTHWLP